MRYGVPGVTDFLELVDLAWPILIDDDFLLD